MYPPKHHQENNFENIVQTIKNYSLATLVSTQNNKSLITHVPLIYEKGTSKYGKLIGHMDKYNPQCKFLNNQYIQVVFNGPDSYISPNYYTTEQLPTWNYIKVHIEGRSKIVEAAEDVKMSIVNMTKYLEKDTNPFVLSIDNPKMNKLVDYIIGFEIEIENWEGKFKLSQDKIDVDKINAKNKLIEKSKKNIQDFVNSIFLNHKNK